MIVILCDSFTDAQEAYDIFVNYLEEMIPFCIRRTYKHCCCVETDDDLRYIFIDHRFVKIFRSITPDILDIDEFFDGIPGFYESDIGEDVLYEYYDNWR